MRTVFSPSSAFFFSGAILAWPGDSFSSRAMRSSAPAKSLLSAFDSIWRTSFPATSAVVTITSQRSMSRFAAPDSGQSTTRAFRCFAAAV